MAVETSTSRIDYDGTGDADVGYPVPFPFHEAADIKVAIKDEDGNVSTLDPAAYSVQFPPGAQVLTDAAVPDTSTVIIYRDVPLTQPTVYPEGGRFLAQSHERAIDRLEFQIQQLRRMYDRTFRVADTSDAMNALVPVNSSLVGFDGFGQPATYDAAYIRELALLGGGDGGNPLATFANEAAKQAATPSYIGQLGIRRDDYSQYIATALSAGSWTRISHGTLCFTAAQLTAALLVGGIVYACGSINISATLEATKPGTKLIGINLGTVKAKITFPHVSGASRIIIDCRGAADVEIRNLELTTNHPLTTDENDIDIAINTYGVIGGSWDTSGLWIDNCDIHNVFMGICHQSGAGGNIHHRCKITNNHIHAFCGTGISLTWELDTLIIDNNHIRGRDEGQTHSTIGGPVSSGNCIWVGAKANYVMIRGNFCHHVDRHGIEYYGSASGNNVGSQIINNRCEDCVMGISAMGNGSIVIQGNQIERAKDIGMELVSFSTDRADFTVVGNSIRDVRFTATAAVPALGISVDGVVNSALITGNQIGKITSPAGLESFGIQLIHTTANIVIRGNNFTDAGTRAIFINGGVGGGTHTRFVIQDNVFLYTTDYADLYPSPTFSGWPAVHALNPTVGVVRENTVWFPTAPGFDFGILSLEGTGTLHIADTGDPTIAAPGNFLGSNLRLAY